MKTKHALTILLTGFLLIASSFTDQFPSFNEDNSTNNIDKTLIRNLPEKQFYDGMITIKVKEGFGDILPQKGAVVFNNTEMDKLVTKFAINEVGKRFRHRPIPKESGLPDLSRIYRISFPEKYSVLEVVTAFSKLKEIEYAEPIPFAYICEVPDNPFYNIQQHLPQIMAAEAWDIHHGEVGTEEIVIGINDTGVDWDHPDLLENIWQNLGEDADGDGHVLEFIGGVWVFDPGDVNGIDDDGSGFADDFIGWDYFMDDNNPDPNPENTQHEDHGSHCAGIAAGRTNNGIGIASVSWNIKIFSTQVDDGELLPWAYDALIYAAEMGVDIISNSWANWRYSKAEEEVIAYVTGLGTIVVAAAGNSETNLYALYPASYPGVISAASVSADDTKASYSNWGKWVDLSAPGGGSEGGIYSTINNGGYGVFSGTSMATPLVAGLFGLVKSYHPTWSNDELIVQVMGTADDIDNLNTGMENELGSGRINAFRALSETTAGPEELRLEFISATAIDDNGNGILEQGEIVNIDLKMWNHCPASRSFNTTFSISCDNPDITLLQDVIIDAVPYDSYFTIENAFQIQIGNNATSLMADFTLDISSDVSITFGDQFMFHLPVMASGVLVWEGQGGGDSYSGEFISEFLSNQDIDNVYCTCFPETFKGFDMVFLSFGNWESYSGPTRISNKMVDIMTVYMEDGGRIYEESSELFGFFEQDNLYLKGLFGIGHTWDGGGTLTPVQHLEGLPNSLANGMFFTESNQLQNYYIDHYETAGSGKAAFIQNEDTIAVQNAEDSLQKTFAFSYSIAELVDIDAYNSRFNLMYRILEFFDHDFDEGYIIANFGADTTYGRPPLTVNFSDWSLHDSTSQITSWEWDFDGNGTIDSWDQDPVWQYNEAGQYNVSLTVSNAFDTNTFVQEKYVWINEGILVYEGVEEGPDYSGTFIRDYLTGIGEDVDYTTTFPSELIGYDAVFLSYGNIGSGKIMITHPMTNIIVRYLEAGGYLYLEGGDCIKDGKKANASFLGLFSLISSNDGSQNEIDGLAGQEDAITYDMYFSGSDQTANESIDKLVPGSDNKAAFEESGYFYVAVQGEGEYEQKTFCFSYTLAALQDGDPPNTREELLNRICVFFDISFGEDELGVTDAGLNLNIFPNPGSDFVNLEYQLNDSKYLSADLYHLSGRKIKHLFGRKHLAGTHNVKIDISDLPAGVYIVRIFSDEQSICTSLIKTN